MLSLFGSHHRGQVRPTTLTWVQLLLAPPPSPNPSSTQQPTPSSPMSFSLGGLVIWPLFYICARVGSLAVGDKRTLLLWPVAQPRQSLYYIHRGWSVRLRRKRAGQAKHDNCCLSKHRRHAGSFPEISSSGEVVVGSQSRTQMRASFCPTRPRRFGSNFFDEIRPVPRLPSPLHHRYSVL